MNSVHWEPDVEPDARMWQELDKLLEVHDAKVMLWEDEPLRFLKLPPRCRSVILNPCGNRPKQGDYMDMMERNLNAREQK